jgi:hypothetical protein
LATQQGVYGYVDTDGAGTFQGGAPSQGFQLLGVGFVPDVNYLWQTRN